MIPSGLEKIPHLYAIKGFLHSLLNELIDKRTGAKRVVSRLNDSTQAVPAPVFVGVVEDEEVTNRRRGGPAGTHLLGDVGMIRFQVDKNPSLVYNATLNDPAGAIQSRDWSPGGADMNEKAVAGGRNPKSLGPSANCRFQRFIAIRIPVAGGQHQHVGTITVGFQDNPTPAQMNDIRSILTKWAQRPLESEYIKYLQANFQLNGPRF
jgi:hypothetical protein